MAVAGWTISSVGCHECGGGAHGIVRLAIRRILELPHPALRQRAKKVRKIDSSVLKLAHDMVDTMVAAGGVGLAANQVGVPRRVIVIKLPEDDEALVYINPEIVHREGEREIEEGCLSIPGYKAFITWPGTTPLLTSLSTACPRPERYETSSGDAGLATRDGRCRVDDFVREIR